MLYSLLYNILSNKFTANRTSGVWVFYSVRARRRRPKFPTLKDVSAGFVTILQRVEGAEGYGTHARRGGVK